MKNFRGIRNNNPANIERGSAWKGLVPFLEDPNSHKRYYDKRFSQFRSIPYGVRACIVVLRTYAYKHKLNTITQIIHRFAPLSENNTYAYIANVVRFIGDIYAERGVPVLKDFASIPFCLFNNPKTPTFFCRCLVKAICKQESNYDLSDDMLDEAIDLL